MHLLADQGASPYSTVLEARTETVKHKPERVQRFVDASSVGWVNDLQGKRLGAHALMLKDNPEMTEPEIEASVALTKSPGIVDSGEAARAGLYKAGEMDLSRVATLQFVNPYCVSPNR